jgi:hypothetical protein
MKRTVMSSIPVSLGETHSRPGVDQMPENEAA